MNSARLAVLVALSLTSCGKLNTLNSFSSDESIYNTAISPQFTAAKLIIQDRCASCHYHEAWSGFTELDWRGSGLVVARNASGSQLYIKLKNNGGDMPQAGAELATAEVQALVDWINTL